MPYSELYDREILRGTNETRPWDLIHEISKIVKPQHRVLDIGCGTASKLIQLASKTNCKEIVGIEPNYKIRSKAKKNIQTSNSDNISIVNGLAEDLPFDNQAFDIVTAMVAPHNTNEIYRVLKPGGQAIIEKIGDRDKWDLKLLFGQDSQGLRGQFCYYGNGERETELRGEFSNLFSEVFTKNGFWKTYYSLEGFLLLLEETPTVRNFDRETDAHIIEEIVKSYMTDKGIITTQNRIFLKAKK